jgi:hypothetical protein
MAQLRLPDIATRLQGLAVAPDRPKWVYAGLADVRRGAPPEQVAHDHKPQRSVDRGWQEVASPRNQGTLRSGQAWPPRVSYSRPIFNSHEISARI